MKMYPTASVESGARIGEDVEIGPQAYIGPHVAIGNGCKIGHGAHIEGHTCLGERNNVGPYVMLGTPPQDLKYCGEPTELVIGDDNVFREFATINAGTVTGLGVTRIGSRNMFMIGSHVGHDCDVEDNVIMVNGVAVGGHCKIESGAWIMGGAGLVQFTSVGKLAYVAGMSGIEVDVPPFMIMEGHRASVRKVNEVGLRRGGCSEEVVQNLWDAFRKIFRAKQLNREKIFDEIDASDWACEETLYLVRFMRRSLQGRLGRYLECFRKA